MVIRIVEYSFLELLYVFSNSIIQYCSLQESDIILTFQICCPTKAAYASKRMKRVFSTGWTDLVTSKLHSCIEFILYFLNSRCAIQFKFHNINSCGQVNAQGYCKCGSKLTLTGDIDCNDAATLHIVLSNC